MSGRIIIRNIVTDSGLAFKYALFALFSMILNISVQRAVLFFDFKFSLMAAMAAGTLAGLVLKYILDKKYIFYFRTKNVSQDINKFILYSFLGGLTTVVFWSVELIFEFYVQFTASKYIGAVLGLTIGYTLKYFLDKKYVFVKYGGL